MSALLDVQNLEAFYGAGQVLHGIGFSVARGEQVALLGRNGMGKTTLLRSLMGLVNDRRGRIDLAGRDIMRAAPEAIARGGVALVPEGRGVFGSLSVVENLVMAARPGTDGRQVWTLGKIYELFPRLHARRGNGGHQLSGGEQQMLTIGRALMTNPDLLLIDEATEGLAPLVAKDIWTTLGVIRGEGVATIVVDKDFRSLSRIADRMVMLSKGTVVFDGTPAARARPEDIVVVDAPLSTRNRAGRPLTLASTQKCPSSAIGMRTAAPSRIAEPVASAFSLCPIERKSPRNAKITKNPAKMAIHTSAILSALPSGSFIAASELSTKTMTIA